MAEIAGLVLGVTGVSGLFPACIESFDIVISGKHFSDDYEQLCALFSLQRARFGLWGESVGLIPNPRGQRLHYDRSLDRPDIKQGVERILNNIRTLLGEAGQIDERYESDKDNLPTLELSDSRGIALFKSSFDRFKSRIKKHQQDTTTWKVTRWALCDGKKFEDMINRLEKFVDALESITKSLGLLADHHARLQAEIEIIPDIRSLKLLRDASSSHRSALNLSPGTASRSFIRGMAESVLEQKTTGPGSTNPGSLNTFFTAHSRRSTYNESLRRDGVSVPDEWPRSIKPSSEGNHNAETNCNDLDLQKLVNQPGKMYSDTFASALDNHDGMIVPEAEVIVNGDQVPRLSLENTGSGDQIEDIPQNQRLIRGLLGKSRPTALSFASGDAKYGVKIASIKEEDENTWHSCNANLVLQAYSSSSAAKRMFVELRSIRLSKVPFISAVPLEDSLDKVLASIEGPPETPYEGGVFFITVKLSEHSQQAPLLRFQTKIYHPNISPQGHICADYVQRWNPKECVATSSKNIVDWWYHRKPGETVWSLGALLTALCGLLAAPEVDDPLVPEIAQKYVEDYDEYCRSAKVYTQLYALPKRPDNNDLVFLEDFEKVGDETARYEPPSLSTEPKTQSLIQSGSSVRYPRFSELHPAFKDRVSSWDSGFDDEVFPKELHDNRLFVPSTSHEVFPIPSGNNQASFAEVFHESATPQNFGKLLLSRGRLDIRHDDTTADGNLNIRIETEGPLNDQGGKTMFQLYHARIHHPTLREFSLQRYCRDSGMDVCHSRGSAIAWWASEHYQKSRDTAKEATILEILRGNDFSNTETHKFHATLNDGCGEPQDSTINGVSSNNTIELLMPNYGLMFLRHRGEDSEERYDFEYWGCDYSWKNIYLAKDRIGCFGVLFCLFKRDEVIAHLIPKTNAGVGAATGELVPPHYIWINDIAVVESPTDLADVVVATGLFALIDHFIRTKPPTQAAPFTEEHQEDEFVSSASDFEALRSALSDMWQ